MPSIRHRFHRVVPAASLSVAFAVTSGPSAHAADVELFVQAPYELDPSLLVRFDLDRLHAHNDDPLFADRFEIPYDVVEPAIAEELANKRDPIDFGTVSVIDLGTSPRRSPSWPTRRPWPCRPRRTSPRGRAASASSCEAPAGRRLSAAACRRWGRAAWVPRFDTGWATTRRTTPAPPPRAA